MQPKRSRSGSESNSKILDPSSRISVTRARGARDRKLETGTHSAARFHQAVPFSQTQRLDKQQLDAAILGKESGFDDFRVVQDDDVAGLEVVGKISETAMLNLARVAVQDQHPRGIAFSQRTRRDELRRKIEVVIGYPLSQAFWGGFPSDTRESATLRRRIDKLGDASL